MGGGPVSVRLDAIVSQMDACLPDVKLLLAKGAVMQVSSSYRYTFVVVVVMVFFQSIGLIDGSSFVSIC